MIAVIDISSVVRHTCFDVFSEAGMPAAVFYSTQTFANSGAIFTADRLVLGRTQFCRTKCEALRWASTIRPGLPTLLLDPYRVELRSLLEVCTDCIDRSPGNNSSACLEAFRVAVDMGLLR
jgi:hypothetical protein